MAKKKVKKEETVRKEIGQQIKARRDSKGLGQHKFAAMIGKDQQRMPPLERGELKTFDTYIAAITVLGGTIKIEWE